MSDHPIQRRSRSAVSWTFALVGFAMVAGCATETVVYRDVPEFMIREGIVPERVKLEDGTVLVYRPRSLGTATVAADQATGAEGRGSAPDGSVTVRAIVPEHVLSITLQCVIDRDWQLLWDQMLSRVTKDEYESSERTFEDFAEFMERNRNDLHATLNRMSAGLRNPEVIIEQGPLGGLRCRFHPHFARGFKFAAVDMVYEDNGLKLLMIRPRIPE